MLRDGHLLVAGVDEVGRGALAGPVSVGVVLVDVSTRSAPVGLRDSKLLTPAAREALVPRLGRWGVARAVGHAEPDEIDRVGILAALRLAGERALNQLPVRPSCILLDGSYDWLTRPREPDGLFDLQPCAVRPGPAVGSGTAVGSGPTPGSEPLEVRTMVKADLRCAAVAAASVLAKTTRDAIMVARHEAHPEFGWADNKGYAVPEHLEALGRRGATPQHRRSWRLPLVSAGVSAGVAAGTAHRDPGGPGMMER